MPNLTTVAAVQAYTGTAANNALLAALVASASSAVLRFLSRDLFQTTYSHVLNGSGTRRQILRQEPVTSVASVAINGQVVPLSTNLAMPGYVFDDIGLWLRGGCFPYAAQAVAVTYTAGFPSLNVTDSPATIPATPYILTPANPYWQADVGVTYFVGGGALTKVNTSPTVGQYFVDAFGVYTFAAADTGQSVVLSYQVLGIPPDISQAVNEIVGLNFTRRQKLNVKSKTIDAQTEAYITDDWPPSAMQTLEQHERTFPET